MLHALNFSHFSRKKYNVEMAAAKKGRRFCILRDDVNECANMACQRAIDDVTRALVKDGQCHLDYNDDNKDQVLSEANCVIAFVTHCEHWWNAFVRDVQICQSRKGRLLIIPVLFRLDDMQSELVLDPESPLSRFGLVHTISVDEDGDEDWITKIVNSLNTVS